MVHNYQKIHWWERWWCMISHRWQGWPNEHPENETSSPLICCVWLEMHHSLCKQIYSPVIITRLITFPQSLLWGLFKLLLPKNRCSRYICVTLCGRDCLCTNFVVSNISSLLRLSWPFYCTCCFWYGLSYCSVGLYSTYLCCTSTCSWFLTCISKVCLYFP